MTVSCSGTASIRAAFCLTSMETVSFCCKLWWKTLKPARPPHCRSPAWDKGEGDEKVGGGVAPGTSRKSKRVVSSARWAARLAEFAEIRELDWSVGRKCTGRLCQSAEAVLGLVRHTLPCYKMLWSPFGFTAPLPYVFMSKALCFHVRYRK